MRGWDVKGPTAQCLANSLKLIFTLNTRIYGLDLTEIRCLLGVTHTTAANYIDLIEAAGVKLIHWQELGDDNRYHPLIRLESIMGHKLIKISTLQERTGQYVGKGPALKWSGHS